MSTCVSISHLSIYLRVKRKIFIKGGQKSGEEKQRQGTEGEEREEVRRKRRTVKAKGKAAVRAWEQHGSRLESQALPLSRDAKPVKVFSSSLKKI